MMPKFPGVIAAGAAAAQNANRIALQSWLGQNRDVLITAIQVDTAEAIAMLAGLVKELPAIALAIKLVMDADTAERAADLIAILDQELAASLRTMLPAVERLQAAWKAGQSV